MFSITDQQTPCPKFTLTMTLDVLKILCFEIYFVVAATKLCSGGVITWHYAVCSYCKLAFKGSFNVHLSWFIRKQLLSVTTVSTSWDHTLNVIFYDLRYTIWNVFEPRVHQPLFSSILHFYYGSSFFFCFKLCPHLHSLPKTDDLMLLSMIFVICCWNYRTQMRFVCPFYKWIRWTLMRSFTGFTTEIRVCQ